MANPNQDARSRQGRYVRTAETVARDAEAARLHGEGWTYQEIADHFGWANKSSSHLAVERALRDVAAPAKGVRNRRERELQLLWDSALEILNNHHVVVSNGRIIELDGQPLQDDGPRLQAIEQLRKVNESWRKLDGIDAPSRVSVEAEQLGREISRLLDATLGPDGDDGDDPDA
ncbi:hypothetical protein [Streptomyces sp. NPDC091215]|uniref:hypothetical protein n=1 Tax=Streptomyces sp. NPDC091215 TaxID=3155192 RepID=UPI0034381B95